MKIKVNKFLILIVLVSVFLTFYRIEDLMPFIGDQGWFYISARDLLISNNFPLVGITASHTWLHQGALWTYFLAIALHLFKFNPIGGVYLSIVFQVLSVIGIYKLSKALFKDERISLTSAVFMATSPFAVIYSRMAYHTSPISFFTICFIYCMFLYSKGKTSYLVAGSLMLGILYNLELATMALWIIPVILVFLVKKYDTKTFFFCLIAFAAPNIPMILFDIQQSSGFYQISAFPRLIKISLFNSGGFSIQSYLKVLEDLYFYNQRLILILSSVLSLTIVIFSVFYATKKWYQKNNNSYAIFVLLITFFVSLAAILFSKTASGAYMPMLFPALFVLISYSFWSHQKSQRNKIAISSLIFIIVAINIYKIIKSDYLTNHQGYISFTQLKTASKKIVDISENKKYNLVRVGEGSEFKENYKNYEYLAWFYGNGPSDKNEKMKIMIEEKNGKIILIQKYEN